MSNSKRVQDWRKRAKGKLVQICGGDCAVCGYNRFQGALEFHHLDPTQKDFAVTGTANIRSFKLMVEEAEKCIMLCANCHREIHDEIRRGVHNHKALAKLRVWDKRTATKMLKETEAGRTSGRFAQKISTPKSELIALHEKLGTYAAVGRQLGVSGTTIQRRINGYPKTK